MQKVIQENSLLYKFLTYSQFRIGRYVLLILALGAVSSNQVFIFYEEIVEISGNKIYLFAIGVFLNYLIGVFFNLNYLVPKFLLQKKYLSYIFLLTLSLLGILVIQLLLEYSAYTSFNIRYWDVHYSNKLIFVLDYISNFIVYFICLSGVSITILLKNWLIENQHLSRLEKVRISSEVEQLKDQINPDLLFNILHHTGELASVEPEKASGMLMKLSGLLRYQLYDSNRSKVLLHSEINFLTNYLSLEKEYLNRITFTVSSEGDVNKTFVPPFIFSPIIQFITGQKQDDKDILLINIHFNSISGKVFFTCSYNNPILPSAEDLSPIRKRLNLLKKNKYLLHAFNEPRMQYSTIELKLDVS